MDFDTKLQTYADLLVVHGLNVQPGQEVLITSELIHRDLVHKIVAAAYKRRAKYVHVDYVDPALTRLRLQHSDDKDLKYVPSFIPVKYEDLVAKNGAVLRLIGSEMPDSLVDLSPQKVHSAQLAYRQSLKKYYEDGVGKSQIHWTVAAAATPQWAKKLFPDLEEEKACQILWDEIFKICRADKPNCLELWQKHNFVLQDRSRKLNSLKIKELHFTGPETDLKVILSPKALFKGGGDLSPLGVEYEPNIPTEECFATPDCRFTEGKVRTTRPFMINGKLIRNLRLEFKEGCISHFSADEGEETFQEYINSDPGAKRLGEVALVGIDSPVFQSGHIFEEILFDENAACHIAIGFAYRFCLEGGPNMSTEELQEIGCNQSHVHTDMMISSEEVDVTATTYSGKTLQLIQNGKWTDWDKSIS